MADMLQKGDTGDEVADVQKRLRELGFDPEGTFGPVTEAAVIAFQESRGLIPDGIVGPNTLRALAEDEAPTPVEPSPSSLAAVRNFRLSHSQYFPEAHPKDLIVLHHTVGGTAFSTYNWWQNNDRKRIATAFIVERDGTIYEVFDPRYWAYHLGLSGTGGRVDRRSIGIEMASEGGLKEQNGTLYKFDRVNPQHVFQGEPYDHGSPWRGYRYFAAYTPEQTDAVIQLTNHLCDTFSVPRRTPTDHLSFDDDLYDYRGVIGHHHVRRDKSDVHPGFDWNRLVENVRLELT